MSNGILSKIKNEFIGLLNASVTHTRIWVAAVLRRPADVGPPYCAIYRRETAPVRPSASGILSDSSLIPHGPYRCVTIRQIMEVTSCCTSVRHGSGMVRRKFFDLNY